MQINRIYLKNFKCFKEEISFQFQKLNLISGNNGKGKSTLAVDSILFAIYGYSSQTLEKLVTRSLKKKECIVRIELDNNNKKLIIERTYPTSLVIYEDGIKLHFSNSKETQDYLNSLFTNIDWFKKFRMVDTKEGINILEEGKTSLKKTLLSLQEDWINTIRQKLLDKKRLREEYTVSKRPYNFYLSTNRLKILEEGYNKLTTQLKEDKENLLKHQEEENNLKTDYNNVVFKLQSTDSQIKDKKTKLNKSITLVNEYIKKIEIVTNKPLKIEPVVIDYDTKILIKEKDLSEKIELLNKNKNFKNQQEKDIVATNIQLNFLQNEINNLEDKIDDLNKQISGLETTQIETECDKCGSLITVERKDKFKTEKEEKITVLVKKIEKLQNQTLEKDKELIELENDLDKIEIDILNREQEIDEIRIIIKTFTNDKIIQTKVSEEIKNQKQTKEAEINKYTELLNVYDKENIQLASELEELGEQKYIIYSEESLLQIDVLEKQSIIIYYTKLYNKLNKKYQLTFQRKTQLNEAFKFSEYKYTIKDVLIINKCIKELDNFYSYFITEWIRILEPIINSILDKIGFKIEFRDDFDIVLYKDNEEYSYKDLSTGQRLILSIAVKLAILLERNEKGLIVADEGFSSLSEDNLEHILTLFKNLPYQLIAIIHRFESSDENINCIEL